MALNNFGIVEPKKLYRGAQPDYKGFQDLIELGVQAVVVLNSNPDDRQGWTGFVLSRPMTGIIIDTDDTVKYVESIATDLNALIERERVYIHCTHGRDRTGLIVAAWRIMFCGWTFTKANSERLMYGDHFTLTVLDAPMVDVLHEIAGKRGLDN